MGQTNYGIMYGCSYTPPEDEYDQDTLYFAARDFEGCPGGTTEHRGGLELIGLWVAVGGSGREGVPALRNLAVQLDAFEDAFMEDPTYCDQVVTVKQAWPEFRAYLEEKTGLELGEEPRLWLTTTETA